MGLNLPILNCQGSVSAESFVAFWSKFYVETQEGKERYDAILKNKLTPNDIIELYTWKNGMRLAGPKLKSVQTNIAPKCDIINQLRTDFNMAAFDERFGKVTTIWKIFLLHIIAPKTYPIFDQHVYRACYYLKTASIKELSTNDNEKMKIYETEYRPFFNEISTQSGCDEKKIDEALMVFGQFLKSNYRALLDNTNS